MQNSKLQLKIKKFKELSAEVAYKIFLETLRSRRLGPQIPTLLRLLSFENSASSPCLIGNWKFEIENSRLKGEVC